MERSRVQLGAVGCGWLWLSAVEARLLLMKRSRVFGAQSCATLAMVARPRPECLARFAVLACRLSPVACSPHYDHYAHPQRLSVPLVVRLLSSACPPACLSLCLLVQHCKRSEVEPAARSATGS
jgi:hypothetical protein